MSINWGRLKSQDRVNDIGKPWTQEEQKAIHEFKIPPAYVRGGILTIKEYTSELAREKKEGKSLEMLSGNELINYAVRLGINVIEEMSLAAIRLEVGKKMKKEKLKTFADVKEYEKEQDVEEKEEEEKETEEEEEAEETEEETEEKEETEEEEEEKKKAERKALKKKKRLAKKKARKKALKKAEKKNKK